MTSIRLAIGLCVAGVGLLGLSARAQIAELASVPDLMAKGDFSAAAAALASPVAAKNPDALMLQGLLHALGAGATYDYPLALDYWRLAAFAGQRDAARLLVPAANSQFAREWWTAKIAGMPPPSIEAPATLVQAERGGLIVDRDRAKKWISREAEAGNPVGLYNAYHAAKFGAMQSEAAKARVRRLLERAAEMKLPLAMKELSSELKQSMPEPAFMTMGFKKDLNRAAELMKETADGGDMQAQLLWAHWLDSQYIEVRDAVAAVEYYLRASDQGDDHAAYFLYRAYSEGKGVEKDESKALHYLQLAAERRNDTGASIYGKQLFRGNGMKADQPKAIVLMEESLVCSLVPNADALALVAYAYASGAGVEKDTAKAIWWAKWAAERGSTYAAELLAHLSAPGKP